MWYTIVENDATDVIKTAEAVEVVESGETTNVCQSLLDRFEENVELALDTEAYIPIGQERKKDTGGVG